MSADNNELSKAPSSSDNGSDKTVGWQATLDIVFALRHDKTVAARLGHRGPLRTQRAFYPEGGHCHMYILHPPGGVVGGDVLQTTIEVQQHAGALLTMPGATKIYRSNGRQATIHQQFHVQDNARLEWLPPGTILFSGARASMLSEFHLEPGAQLMARETYCLGRPVMGEGFEAGGLRADLRVYLASKPLLLERLRVSPGLATLAGYPLVSTLLIYPGSTELLDDIRDVLEGMDEPAGATLVDGLLVVRMLASSNLRLDQIQSRLWACVRQRVMGLEPVPPRIWAT